MSKNKKISKKSVILVATILVGGTLAWFTSQDELRNIFSTEDDLNSGIQIEENFSDSVPDKDGNPVYSKPIIPGTDITKEAWVQSKANYDQFVRAKIVKEFRDKDGNVVNYYKLNDKNLYEYISKEEYDLLGDKSGWEQLNIDYIEITYPAFVTDTSSKGWSDVSSEGWHYYSQIVKANNTENEDDKTTNLITTVKLSSDAENAYLNLRFDVEIVSESIQATGGAIKDTSGWGNDAPEYLKALDTTN